MSSKIYLQQVFWECGRIGGALIPTPPVRYAEVVLPSAPVSQYICMKLPKTDNNGRTRKNDANVLSCHIFNAFFQTSAL